MLTFKQALEAVRQQRMAREAEREAQRAAQPAYRVYWVNPITSLLHKLPSFTVPVDNFTAWAFVDHDFDFEQVLQCMRDVEQDGRGFIETFFSCYIVERA